MEEITELERKKKAGKKLSPVEQLEYESLTRKERKRILLLEKIRRNLKQLDNDVGELVTTTKVEDDEFCKDMLKGVEK